MPAKDVRKENMTRACIVCEAPTHARVVICHRPECMEKWQAWRSEVSLRPTHARPVQQMPDIKPRMMPCRDCGCRTPKDSPRGGLCCACYEIARRKQATRSCVACDRVLDGEHGSRRYCNTRCENDARNKRRNEAKRPAITRPPVHEAQATRKPPARAGCATCEHGRLSRRSETGYECGLQAYMRCKPDTLATLYQWWEAQDA